jgi:hypothetical protein
MRFSPVAAMAACFVVIGCSTARVEARQESPISMRFDYAAAETLVAALERDSLSDAAVDSLLLVPGIRAVVDNVTRFRPLLGVPQFRDEIMGFVRTKQAGSVGAPFQLTGVLRAKDDIRMLVSRLRANERAITDGVVAQLKRYQPPTGAMSIMVYVVAGGVSDGFYFDDQREPTYYVNLARVSGDLNGVVADMAHETYHVLQKTAQRRVPSLIKYSDSTSTLPLPERLLNEMLSEGTAQFVVDPTRSDQTGPYLDRSRAQYARNAQPARIAENFAAFDSVLRDVIAGRLDWNQAYQAGFSGSVDSRFYFVGYEMAKAIDRYCGHTCIGALFGKPPVEFFRQYISLYKAHPEITARFAPDTETFIMNFSRGS